MAKWTFITNHGSVLALVAQHPRITAREIAALLQITEWSVFRVMSDLTEDGYVTRSREGRRNVYEVNHQLNLRRPELVDVVVGDLLKVMDDIKRLPGMEAEDKEQYG
ncbi:MAG: helix-turn-helix domain-containing protein [Chloroflexi bacterium]|nr:helix-turn-helix domain-containing protein [Chloroflexota bacterium]